MKNIALHFIACLFLLNFSSITQAKTALEQQWSTPGLKTPESVLFYKDGKSAYLFVSQVDGDPSAADGSGAIAKMSVSGDIKSLDWVTGLNAPKGMATFGGKLYVADIHQLVIINIKTGVIEKKITVDGAEFLNDVAADAQGVIYLSDTKTKKIFRFKLDVIDLYLDMIEGVDGLKAIGSNLAVASGTHVYLVDKNKNRLQLASGFAHDIDGVEAVGGGDLVVSCFAGLIYYVHIDGRLDLLLDTQAEKITTADIGYDPDAQTVFVPNFTNNSVTAYRLTQN